MEKNYKILQDRWDGAEYSDSIFKVVALLAYLDINLEDLDEEALASTLDDLACDNCSFYINSEEYFVFDNSDIDSLLDDFRENAIADAKWECPERLKSYVDYSSYAEDMYESIYDIYNYVSDPITIAVSEDEERAYYICQE